ncbi:MAG: hypothetical protein WKG06_35610 [Segetibacter sp.]
MPDKYDILEEGIDILTQKEYFDYSHTFDRGELTEKDTIHLSNILFDQNTAIDPKKKALVLLAHLGTVLAFRQIEKSYKNPDKTLRQWTALALQECKMFLESSLIDENIGFISTGLGGLDNRLRYYFLILSSTDRPFYKNAENIIKDEFSITCMSLNSVLETIDYSDVLHRVDRFSSYGCSYRNSH